MSEVRKLTKLIYVAVLMLRVSRLKNGFHKKASPTLQYDELHSIELSFIYFRIFNFFVGSSDERVQGSAQSPKQSLVFACSSFSRVLLLRVLKKS